MRFTPQRDFSASGHRASSVEQYREYSTLESFFSIGTRMRMNVSFCCEIYCATIDDKLDNLLFATRFSGLSFYDLWCFDCFLIKISIYFRIFMFNIIIGTEIQTFFLVCFGTTILWIVRRNLILLNPSSFWNWVKF
jgi:hypothetical protein